MSSSSRRGRSKRARDQQPQQQQDDESKHDAASSATSSSPPPPTRRARVTAASGNAAASAHAVEPTAAEGNAVLTAADADQRASRGAAAAAFALTLPSPAARCDLDSLSIVLSMLNTADFLSAIRVCRQWRAARMRHTAWPAMQLEPLIRSLQDDNYDDAARRRFEATFDTDVSRVSSLLAHGSMWHHVTDVKVNCERDESRMTYSDYLDEEKGPPHEKLQQTACEALLPTIAVLPFLQVLNLFEFKANSASVRNFYSAISERLQVAMLFGRSSWWSSETSASASFVQHLPLLSSLRVLVIDREPPARSLIGFSQLRYIHLSLRQFGLDPEELSVTNDVELGRVLRMLSQQSLRHVSLESSSSVLLAELFRSVSDAPLDLTALAQDAETSVEALKEALERLPEPDYSQSCGLTDVSIEGAELTAAELQLLSRQQNLRRLQVEVGGEGDESDEPDERLPLDAGPHMHELRVRFGILGFSEQWALDWRHFARCSQLRVLQLSLEPSFRQRQPLYRRDVAVENVLRVLTNAAATLEVMRLDPEMRIAFPKPPRKRADAEAAKAEATRQWSVLEACVKLRELELTLQQDMPASIFDALSRAASFCTLTLTEVSVSLLPPRLLRCMAASRTWSTLHLHLLLSYLKVTQLEAMLPAAQVDASTVQRLRVHVHRTKPTEEHCTYAVQPNAKGQMQWQQM